MKRYFENKQGMYVTESSPITVTNTTNETPVFSDTIPGSSLQTNRTLRFECLCTLTTGLLPPTLTILVKYGNQSLTVASSISLATSLSTARPIRISGTISAQDSANAQLATAQLIQYSNAIPVISSSGASVQMADLTVDSSQDQTFSVTVQWSSALSGTTIVCKRTELKLE